MPGPIRVGGKRLTTSANLLADLHPIPVSVTFPGRDHLDVHALVWRARIDGVTWRSFARIQSRRHGADAVTYRLASLTASPPAMQNEKPAL